MAGPRREAGGSTRHASWRPWVVLLLGLLTSIIALAGFISIAAGVVEREVEASTAQSYRSSKDPHA